MENRGTAFILFIIGICLIVLGGVGVSYIMKYSSDIWTAKAAIAQAQPLIEIAKGQAAIDNAAAFQILTSSVMNIVFSIAPYIIIFVWLAGRVAKNAKV